MVKMQSKDNFRIKYVHISFKFLFESFRNQNICLLFKVSWYSKDDQMNFCGGSIYSENVIITAAHCCQGIFESDPPAALEDFYIIGGELDLSKDSGTEQRRNIKAYKYHPDYATLPNGGCENDVCLLYLDTPFDLTQPDISTITIAQEDPAQSTECLISGWGTTYVSRT